MFQFSDSVISLNHQFILSIYEIKHYYLKMYKAQKKDFHINKAIVKKFNDN